MPKRIALVTGGMGGIGQAISQKLHQQGIHVIVGYSRNQEKAQTWLDEQKKLGYQFDSVYVNVTEFDSCAQMAKKIETEIGPVDILINNAGLTKDRSFCKMEKEDWNIVIETDLNSIFYVTRMLISGMLERRFGRIINMSSINGQKGQFGQVNYAAAKAGIHGFTKALAIEVAKKNVTVNTVSPGYVATDMVLAIPKNIQDKILAEIPMGRFAQPEEVANVVAFLVQEENNYITGANIMMNGGHYML